MKVYFHHFIPVGEAFHGYISKTLTSDSLKFIFNVSPPMLSFIFLLLQFAPNLWSYTKP